MTFYMWGYAKLNDALQLHLVDKFKTNIKSKQGIFIYCCYSPIQRHAITVCCCLTIVLSDWLESFNPGTEDLDPARQGQMLSNYLCVFTTHRKQIICIYSAQPILDWPEDNELDLLVKWQWFQWDEGDNSVAQRFTQGAQVLSILQVNDQLSVKPVPGCILNSLKISE